MATSAAPSPGSLSPPAGVGAPPPHLVDFAHEIDEAWLEGVTTVGLASGASAPEVLVDGVLESLAERGYDDLDTVTTALPHELRRDLRSHHNYRAGMDFGVENRHSY